jgi:hypothetical protein
MHRGYRQNKNLIWLRDGNPLDGDPSTNNPIAIYNELGHIGGDWEDNISSEKFETAIGVSATTINSLSAWLSNGVVTSRLQNVGGASFPFLTTDTDLVWYFVLSPKSSVVNRYPFQFPSAGAGSFYGFYNGTTITFNFRDDDLNTCTNTATVANDEVIVVAVQIHQELNNCTMDLWRNGVKASQATQSTFTPIEGDVNSNLFNLVANNAGWYGRIAEIDFFVGTHSDALVEKISAFLMNKWGVS